jgi:DNA-binding PadR family transcriptional regulator
MRPYLVKGAHVDLSRSSYRKAGVSRSFSSDVGFHGSDDALTSKSRSQHLTSIYKTSILVIMKMQAAAHDAKRSNIAMAILAMLYESPMHPYRMQQLIKERGKHAVINVSQRASLYQTINRLEREGLISAQKIAKAENRPERTIYEITTDGTATLRVWIRDMLATPVKEYPEFPAALSVIGLLPVKDALAQLRKRAELLEAELKHVDREMAQASFLPRLFLLEMELIRAQLATELTWVKTVVSDLYTGQLTWSEAWLRKMAAKYSQKQDENQAK